MTQIFGEVASMYDDVRPAYPSQVLDAIIEYHGGVPASVVDLGGSLVLDLHTTLVSARRP